MCMKDFLKLILHNSTQLNINTIIFLDLGHMKFKK